MSPARPRAGTARAARPATRFDAVGRAVARAVVEAQVLHPPVVAAEQLVAAVAGEQHLRAVRVDGPRDVGDRDPRRVRARDVHVREPVVEGVAQVASSVSSSSRCRMPRSAASRAAAADSSLGAERDRVGGQLRRSAWRAASAAIVDGVEAAREHQAERNVADERGRRPPRRAARGARPRGAPPCGCDPSRWSGVPVLGHLEPAVSQPQHVPGRELADALDQRALAERVAERRGTRPRPPGRAGRGPTGGRASCASRWRRRRGRRCSEVVERLDADLVARGDELPRLAVPDDEREHPPKPVECWPRRRARKLWSTTSVSESVRNRTPRRSRSGSQLAEVEELAVVDEHPAAGRVGEGLIRLRILRIDDREPAVLEHDLGRSERRARPRRRGRGGA